MAGGGYTGDVGMSAGGQSMSMGPGICTHPILTASGGH